MVNRAKYFVAQAYLEAKVAVLRAGFLHEIAWQEERRLATLTEREFLSEAAWAILSAGMRETIIRRKFPDISAAFLHWRSAAEISERTRSCRRRALAVFNNERKIGAIAGVALQIATMGFDTAKAELEKGGARFLLRLAGLGPVTSVHLAKNIGIQIAKPDRHLVRIAKSCGYPSPGAMCEEISLLTDEKIGVIDSVLWRYATLTPNYESIFRIDEHQLGDPDLARASPTPSLRSSSKARTACPH